MQSVFFRHDVSGELAKKFFECVGCNLASVRMACPDTEEGAEVLDGVVVDWKNRMGILKLKQAIRRCGCDDMMAAARKRVVSLPSDPPSSKVSEVDDVKGKSVTSGASTSKSSASLAIAAKLPSKTSSSAITVSADGAAVAAGSKAVPKSSAAASAVVVGVDGGVDGGLEMISSGESEDSASSDGDSDEATSSSKKPREVKCLNQFLIPSRTRR